MRYYIAKLFISSSLLHVVLIRASDITGAYRCYCNCMPTGHLTFYRPNASPNVMTTSTYRCLRNVCRPRLPEEICYGRIGVNAIYDSSGSSFEKKETEKVSVSFVCTGEKSMGM